MEDQALETILDHGLEKSLSENEANGKEVKVKVLAAQSRPAPCNPMDYTTCQAPLSMEFPRQENWSG